MTLAENVILEEAAIQNFEGRLGGDLIRPNHDGYDEARKIWNGMIDRRSSRVARGPRTGSRP